MIFNELEYAKKMINSGFIQDKYSKELRILAKYYNKELNLKTDKIKEKLKEFCEKYLPKYNEVLHLDMIIKASRYGVKKNNRLLKIQSILITKNELTTIESLKDIKLETFSFVTLVLSKINKFVEENYKDHKKKKCNKKYEYYCNNLKEMFISSKIRCNKEQRESYIDLLSQTSLFDYTIFGTFKVNFVDEIEEVVIEINKYENFVLEYMKYKGENIGYCEVCEIPFYPTNNFQKYCKTCAKEIEKENHKDRNREYMRKVRSVDEGENS